MTSAKRWAAAALGLLGFAVAPYMISVFTLAERINWYRNSPMVEDGAMAYLKPPSIETKIFNKLAMHSTLWDVHTLEVARRNGVDPQRVPVIPVEQDGSLFIVSTRGEADWVKNVRAAGIVRLGQKGNFETYAAAEVPTDERAGIVTAYRKKAGREVNGYWKKLPADSDHPTFKLTPS